jgi:hypothetical protein
MQNTHTMSCNELSGRQKRSSITAPNLGPNEDNKFFISEELQPEL